MRRHALPLRFLTLEDRLAPATLTVNSLLDTVVADGVLTLREAVNAVNSQSNAALSATEKAQITGSFGSNDTIQFASSLNGSTIQLNGTSRLNLQRNVTITGPGADKLAINGGRDIGATKGTQIFFVDGRTNGSIAVTINGLTLERAFARAGTGTTTNGVDNSIRGGAIFNDNATLSVNSCYFEDNQASFGGAISNFGNQTILQNSTFYNNRGTTNGGAITNGGGLVRIVQSTVDFNHSEGVTGAVTNNAGTMQIIRSTISGNYSTNPAQVNYAAGGVWTNTGADTILQATCISGNFINTLTRADFNSFAPGGASISVNTVSANNFVSHPQSAGGLNPLSNILGNGSGATVDPNLSLLQMNGGTVPTLVPRSGSVLIGKGGIDSTPGLTDARGFPRQANDSGVANVNATIDIGATERINQAFTITVNENSGFIAGERDTNFTNAIRIANENLGTQTINFSPTVFATPQTVTLSTNFNAEFAINEALVINGPAARLTIDAQGKSRIFNTSGGLPSDVITINNLTLTGGSNVDGGAVNIGDEIVNFNDCTLTGNTSSNDGGAINVQNVGTLNLLRTTISGNSAASSGGGVYVNSSGSATIVDSAIINNKAGSTGGGFYFFGTVQAGGLTFRNTTISGNSSGSSGGGAVFPNFTGIALFQNCTITGNTAGSGNGGGAAQTYGTGILEFQSCIVSGNTNANAPDISSTAPVDVVFSALGSTAGFTFGDNANNLAAGTNLLLGPLANNGGPTLTHQPAANSPVKNKGSNPANLQFDARGSGFPRSADGGVDIGAVEAVLPVSKTFTVTNVNDSGTGSLRQAVLDANANAGVQDTITFSSFFNSARIISLTTGELSFSEVVTITGPGANLLTITANGKSRIFNTEPAPAVEGEEFIFSNMTLTGGKVTGTTANDVGGAMLVDQGVALIGCVITGNSSVRGGGAIGARANTAEIKMNATTISGNSTSGNGGGIYFYNGGAFTFTSSTISGNTSTGKGGGLYFYSNITYGTTILQQATFSGNSAGGTGGGIALIGPNSGGGTLLIQNSTIVNNTSSGNGGGIGRTNAMVIDIQSSIVSGNTSGKADISSSGTVNVNNSAIGDTNGFTFSGSSGNNLAAGTNLLLGPLQDNGGPTLTHQPAANSPVKNKGSNPANLTTDARGPGFPRSSAGGVDIGALEAALPGPLNLVVTNTNDSGTGSLRQAILDANANEGPDNITFQTGLGAISLTSGELAITDTTGTTTITRPTNGLQIIQRSTAVGTPEFRIFSIAAGASATLQSLTIANGRQPGGFDGGGVLVSGGALTLLDCTVRDNSSSGNGGGVSNIFGATLNISNSSIVNNTSGTPGSNKGGAGINNFQSTVAVINSTISGNSAAFSGGGVYNFAASTITLTNCTISNNRSDSDGDGGGNGGGLRSNGTATLTNTIVAGNFRGTGTTPDDIVTPTALASGSAFNLIGIGTANGLANGVNGNQLGVANAKLSPLSRVVQGPEYFVHFLFGGSPAINAGNPATTAADVFGVAPVVRRDIGAIEFNPKVAEYEYSVGRDQGAQGSVTLFDFDNTPRFTITPFGSGYTGGIRTAAGDVTGDGVADLIVASGVGMKGTVKVFDGVTQAQIPLPETVQGGGTPFGDTFTRGILVAAGDLNADGLSDLIITAEKGGGARVRVFQSTGTGFVQRSDFIALIDGLGVPDSKIFRGGSRATASDINGDGINDLIWAAGAGGGPRIATFNGALIDNGNNFNGFKMTGDFFALGDTSLRDGCFLAGGDITGDGIGDIVFGGSTGAPPIIVAQSGANLIANISASKGSAQELQNRAFFATQFGTNSKNGIRVAVKDLNFDNIADLIVGSAPGAGSRVTAFDGNNLSGSTTGPAIFDVTAFPGFSGGVFVG